MIETIQNNVAQLRELDYFKFIVLGILRFCESSIISRTFRNCQNLHPNVLKRLSELVYNSLWLILKFSVGVNTKSIYLLYLSVY